MALTPCPKCGESISDDAPACPRCGAAASASIPGAPKGLVIQVIVRLAFAVAMGIFLWLTLRHPTAQTTPPSNNTPPPQVQPH